MGDRNDQPADLRTAIIDRVGAIATAPDRERRFPVGPDSAKPFGHDASEVNALPRSLTASFCGVGNPFAMGEPEPGQTVLDRGCGAGFDTLLAACRVGPSGRAGFAGTSGHRWTGYRTSPCTQGALVSAVKPGPEMAVQVRR